MAQPRINQITGLPAALGTKFDTVVNASTSGVSLYSSTSNTSLILNTLSAGNGIQSLAVVNGNIIIAVNSGSTANKIVALDGSARLPAVDGSLLTNLNAAAISGTLNLTAITLPLGNTLVGNSSNNPTVTPLSGISLSSFGALTGDLNIGTNNITTSATSWSPNDLVPRSYVDGVAQGTVIKVAVTTTTSGTNINLSSPGATIGGYNPNTGDRILIKDQTDGTQNGVYIFATSTTSMTRASDALLGSDFAYAQYYVTGGDNINEMWHIVQSPPITVGTTMLTFTQVAIVGQLNPTNGLQKVGTLIELLGDNVTIGVISGSAAVISSSVTGQVLVSQGSNTLSAQWNAVNLSNPYAVTGTLGTQFGGTGLISIVQNSILVTITADNIFQVLTLPINSVIGRLTSNIQTLAKADLRALQALRPAIDIGNGTYESMELLSLSNTPDDASKVLLFFNGQLLKYNSDYTIAGNTVFASVAYNEALGGASNDGTAFAATDNIAAFYTY